MPGATNNGGEDSTRGVVSSKSGFAHSGSIVNNECGDFIIHGSTAEGKKKFKYHIHFQLPLQWAHFLLVDCSWTNCPLGGANTQHSDYQTKGSSAASHHYHIRTCFVLEQLCGYRRHGALPSTSITNLIHNDPALSDHSRYFTKQASLSSSDSVALSICLYS